jgi:endonuclease-3
MVLPCLRQAAIKIGGLAATKVQRIKAICRTLLEERPQDCMDGEPSLEYIRSMSTDDIKKELGRFKGVGPKTIACVCLFTLGREEFAVDTHVWHISKRLGWVPQSASREDTYDHLNGRVPDEIKYSLHVLMVLHGKKCTSCSKGGRTLLPSDGPCPLVPAKLRANVKGEK